LNHILDNSSTHLSDQSSNIPQCNTPICKSTCIRCKTGYLQQYHCQLAAHSLSLPPNKKQGIPYSLSCFIAYNHISPTYKHFCLNISSHIEPKFFHQVVKSQHWRDAMHAEIYSLELNNTWIVVDLPSHKQPIGCKWIYKLNFKVDVFVE